MKAWFKSSQSSVLYMSYRMFAISIEAAVKIRMLQVFVPRWSSVFNSVDEYCTTWKLQKKKLKKVKIRHCQCCLFQFSSPKQIKSGLSCSEILKRLIDLGHGISSYPRQYLLFNSKCQHLFNLFGTTDKRSVNVDLVQEQRGRADGREVPVSNHGIDKATIGFKKVEVIVPLETRLTCASAKNMGKSLFVRGHGLCIACNEKIIGT